MNTMRAGAAALAAMLVLGGGAYAAGSAAADDGTGTTTARPGAAASTSVPAPETETTPVITRETIRERERIPFRSVERRTARLKKGVRRVSQAGRAGVRVRVIKIVREDGVEVKRKVVKNFVARRPVARIVLVGTRVEQKPAPSRCDPNYTGACVPIASDVDCAGGSGNGPAYVDGPVRVVGDDIYDLDSDGDGYGCED